MKKRASKKSAPAREYSVVAAHWVKCNGEICAELVGENQFAMVEGTDVPATGVSMYLRRHVDPSYRKAGYTVGPYKDIELSGPSEVESAEEQEVKEPVKTDIPPCPPEGKLGPYTREVVRWYADFDLDGFEKRYLGKKVPIFGRVLTQTITQLRAKHERTSQQ